MPTLGKRNLLCGVRREERRPGGTPLQPADKRGASKQMRQQPLTANRTIDGIRWSRRTREAPVVSGFCEFRRHLCRWRARPAETVRWESREPTVVRSGDTPLGYRVITRSKRFEGHRLCSNTELAVRVIELVWRSCPRWLRSLADTPFDGSRSGGTDCHLTASRVESTSGRPSTARTVSLQPWSPSELYRDLERSNRFERAP